MKTIFTLLLLTISSSLFAEQRLLMTRSPDKADVAFDVSLQLIEDYGYSIAHIQTCNEGMEGFGYHSDFYQVVFFGKMKEIRAISSKHPELVPFLPLKLAVFAEKNETIITILNPMNLKNVVSDPNLNIQLLRWKNDIESILDELSKG